MSPISPFSSVPDSPSGPSPSSLAAVPTFMERLGGLPLVRAAVSRIQEVYETTKGSSPLIRGALERGETTLNYSLTRAADIVHSTGLLQKSLYLADSSACFVLDKVEQKLPIISKSPYEIKLMISDKWEGKMDQVSEAKETAVRFYDGYKSFGTQTITSAKEVAALKAQAVLATPVGLKVDHVLERSLTLADSAVDRFLPEGGYSHKNGNGTANGHYAHTNGNGYATSLDHAKSLSRKLKRRVSAKSSDVVDSLMQHRTVSSVAEVAKKNINSARQVTSDVYYGIARATGKVVDIWYTTMLFLLPKSLQSKLTVLLDGVVNKMVNSRRHSLAESEAERSDD